MSMYGPQGGPYPGQPQDPWQGGQAPDSYGYADPHYAHPHYAGGQYADPHYGAAPAGEVWGPPQPPPRRRGSGLVIGIVIAVALLVIGGTGAAVYLLGRDKNSDVTTGPSTGPSAGVSSPAVSTPPSSAASSRGATGPNSDTRNAKAGDCLVNRGTESVLDMRKVTCAANTYQVLKRIDGTADKAKCDGTAGLTDWYFYDNADNRFDFVLCLKKR